jgi:hypothetical protein
LPDLAQLPIRVRFLDSAWWYLLNLKKGLEYMRDQIAGDSYARVTHPYPEKLFAMVDSGFVAKFSRGTDCTGSRLGAKKEEPALR